MRGLYIHIPFCETKCPYCSFYSYIEKDKTVIERYFDTLITEIKTYNNLSFDTIYIGGGTPSSVNPNILDTFFNSLFKLIKYNGEEFTIEVNPNSFTKKFIDVIDRYNINRISMGVQSFDNNVLKLLGRNHKATDIFKSLELIDLDKYRLNLDMIYDIPTVEDNIIFDTLESIVKVNPSHISAYSYQHEDTGYLANNINLDKTLFSDIENKLRENGYEKYEVSNFSKKRMESKHNMIYWNMNEYIGIGSSASSMYHTDNKIRIRHTNTADIEKYINGIETSNKVFDDYEELDIEKQISESLIFGLRLKNGIDLSEVEKKYTTTIPERFLKNIDILTSKGLLTCQKKKLIATERGAEVLDTLSLYLL